MAWWGVETVERRHGAVGSGVRARHNGERRRGTVGSGVPARRGGEWRHGAVGSGDGGVRHDSMGIGE
jgi:hypothetical protein